MLHGTVANPGTKTPLVRNPYFWAAVGAAIAFPAYRVIVGPATPALPVLGQVPDVALVDQHGRPFKTGEIRRTAWIANFFFTSCATVCPPMMTELARVQGRLSDEELPVRIVSITVDPHTDRPEVLRDYGTRLGADFDRWSFVTGEPDTIAAPRAPGIQELRGHREPRFPSGVVGCRAWAPGARGAADARGRAGRRARKFRSHATRYR